MRKWLQSNLRSYDCNKSLIDQVKWYLSYLSKLLLTDDNLFIHLKEINLSRLKEGKLESPMSQFPKKNGNENISLIGLYKHIIDHWFKHHSLG